MPILLAFISFPTQGHEGIDKQIRWLNERLLVSPEDYRLYLRRGDLYRRHKEWNKALHDFNRVERLETGHYSAVLGRAQLELDRQQPQICIQILDKLIKRRPNLAPAYFVRARALVETDKISDAAKAYTHGINLLDSPRPDHYLERARALASDSNRTVEAIRSIDDGLSRLPHNISLEQYATDLEIKIGRYAPALARIDRVLENSGQLPVWLVLRADVLSHIGHAEDIKKAYQTALNGILQLPARRQNTAAMNALKTRIIQGLDAAAKRNL